MRDQYKLLQEKYDIINDARKPKTSKIGPYEADHFNFLEYTKNYPDQEEFIDWLYSQLEGRGETGDDMFDETEHPIPIWAKLCLIYDNRVGDAGYGITGTTRMSAIEDEINEQENNIDRDYQKWLTKKLLKKASDETGIEMDI